jgi:hypothetical protein
MDVRVATDTLRAARASAVHYSKNIAFTNYTTCSMVIRELALIDLGRRLDLSRTDYRDEVRVLAAFLFATRQARHRAPARIPGRAAHRHCRSNRDICGAKQPTQACSSLVRLLALPDQASRFNPSMICSASFLLCLSRYASVRRRGRSSRSSSTLSVACAGLNCSDRTRSAR